MTIEIFTPHRDETLNRTLTLWLCRIAGLALFGLGLVYWVRLIGVFEGDLWRFDLMPAWWRTAAATLAVLYPVTGIGLWMAVSWGAVMWIVVAGVEAVMHLGFPALFGGDLVVLGTHLLGLGLLGALKIVARIDARRRLAARGVRALKA